MSWDVMLLRTATNTEPMEEIDDTNTLPLDINCAISAVIDIFPGVEHRPRIPQQGDLEVYYYEEEKELYAITFFISSQDLALSIHLINKPYDAAVPKIKELSSRLQCRAWDTASNEFF